MSEYQQQASKPNTFHIIDEQPRQIIGSPFRIGLPVISCKLSATNENSSTVGGSNCSFSFQSNFGPRRVVGLKLSTYWCYALKWSCDKNCALETSLVCELPFSWITDNNQEEHSQTQPAYWKQQLGITCPYYNCPRTVQDQLLGLM